MKLHYLGVANFRLLAKAELALEDETTVIVGRNNSGKTSLGEVVRRLLMDNSPMFQLEDFSSCSFDAFVRSMDAVRAGRNDGEVRKLLPFIELTLTFEYSDHGNDPLGPLGPFIVDLDPDCTEALVVVRYELKDGMLGDFFKDLADVALDEGERPQFYHALRSRIPQCYTANIWAVDPKDSTNRRLLSAGALRALLKAGFINAQRGLDDVTSRDSDMLAKTVELLFATASLPSAEAEDKQIADELSDAVRGVQDEIDKHFGGQLKGLVPALNSFGYPGLGDQNLLTETLLDVRKLLSNFTKVRYEGYGGITLPESYNGLGARNLIFILLQLASFYKSYCAGEVTPGVQVIFIEEPEAHLHPQMQEVFIRQLTETKRLLVESSKSKKPWPVQFVVSTHSSHLANEAGFESIRYFLSVGDQDGARRTKIKDLRRGMADVPRPTREFLQQYLTLTKCDLFFADKAVLVEGLSERLLLPEIVARLESLEPDLPKLSAQYLTTLEVGGAYAHLFFDLLSFLELRTLIITDIDTVEKPGGKACPVHLGIATSNGCLKAWFADDESLTPDVLLAKTDADKTRGIHRVAFQCSEEPDGPCGRTLEDAFILANRDLFDLEGDTREELESSALAEGAKHKKSEFALKHAIHITDWVTPKYIHDGARWLAGASEALQAIAGSAGNDSATE